MMTQLTSFSIVRLLTTELYLDAELTDGFWYSMAGPIANIVCLMYVDKCGIQVTLYITGILITIDISLVMAITSVYGKSDNLVGKGFYFTVM